MEGHVFNEDIWISKLLKKYPQTAMVLINLRVDCVGCPLNRFCTVLDLCEYYDLDHAWVWDEILKVID